jgi:hypothetical protein
VTKLILIFILQGFPILAVGPMEAESCQSILDSAPPAPEGFSVVCDSVESYNANMEEMHEGDEQSVSHADRDDHTERRT